MNDTNKPQEKKKQAPSASYTLRSFGGNNRKLKELKLITKEEFEVLERIKGEAVQKYMKTQF